MFDTGRSRPSRGVEKGRYRVEVIGFVVDSQATDDDNDDQESGGLLSGRALFTPHRFEHDFSSNETLKIVVPDELEIKANR